jgi:hypothetical protein
MTELVSRCNKANCNVSCACIPNPCYEECETIICTPFCKPRCLQAVGGCHGDACPVEDIEKKSKEIKETEDKIFEALKEIEKIFPRISFLLEGKNNPRNLNNVGVSTGLCYSSDINNPAWAMLSCQQAQGNYGPDGQIITNCNPRNFYCCSLSGQTQSLPSSIEAPLIYIIPAKKYKPLETDKDNCPKGWLCDYYVKYYNQYKDASKSLKQLLSCMRKRLDIFQDQEGLKDNIVGEISSISDDKLYKGTCGWETGPKETGGCSHLYETKHGRERVSAHYGGTYCSYKHKSYAVDIDISTDFQKKYLGQIIEAAKKCSPGAYILDETTSIHIDIGETYHCGSNDY